MNTFEIKRLYKKGNEKREIFLYLILKITL